MPPAPAGFVAQSGQKVDVQQQRRGNFVDTSKSCCGNLQLPALVLQPVILCQRSEARQRGGLRVAVAEKPPFDSTQYLLHGAAGPAVDPPPSIVILTRAPKLKQSLNFYLNRKASRFLDRTDSVATNLLLQFKKQTSV